MQLNAAQEAIFRLLPTRRALAPTGRFERIGVIPRDAWLEGLVNAAIHRSYSISGDHIRIEIFDDRIEVESPGRFPGISDMSNPLKVTRFARNPRIARVCADLEFGQELGEGIRRIFEEMRLAGLADPRVPTDCRKRPSRPGLHAHRRGAGVAATVVARAISSVSSVKRVGSAPEISSKPVDTRGP